MSGGSYTDDSVTSAFSTNQQDAQKLLTVPGRLILDEMLTQLGFPLAQYEHRRYEDYKVCVTVIFQTSKLTSQGSRVPVSISGVKTMDTTVAEHTAAVAAIRYLENVTNTVVKDLSYNLLKETRDENELLKTELKDIKKQLQQARMETSKLAVVKRQLKKSGEKGRRLARGWFYSVRSMFSFSAQFYNVAILNNFAEQEIVSDDMKAAFATIYEAARMLRSKSNRLETKLEDIRRS